MEITGCQKDLREFTLDLHKEADGFRDWYFAQYSADPKNHPLLQTEEKWDELYAEFMEKS